LCVVAGYLWRSDIGNTVAALPQMHVQVEYTLAADLRHLPTRN
jgi:hypothetical protein